MRKFFPAYLILAAAVLAGLYLWLRPAAPLVSIAPGPQRFALEVSGGRRIAGPELIRVHQGDQIVLAITSDQADEFHLHGYDLHLELQPGQPAQLAFTASRSGRFSYELHHADLQLGALEVLPP